MGSAPVDREGCEVDAGKGKDGLEVDADEDELDDEDEEVGEEEGPDVLCPAPPAGDFESGLEESVDGEGFWIVSGDVDPDTPFFCSLRRLALKVGSSPFGDETVTSSESE
jgi:hypothetical protein